MVTSPARIRTVSPSSIRTTQRAVVGQVDSHARPPVARAGAAAYALGALEPCFAEALHARGEKARVPVIESGQHGFPHLGEIVGAPCLHP